jgi:predicted glycosyltransferase involved in capsule biosynthesis
VIEQETENIHSHNITDRFPNVSHIKYNLNQTKFNKSKLLNTHIQKIKSDYIWVYDVDVYLDVDYVLSQIPSDIQLVRPFEFIIHLNEHESTYLFKSSLIKTKKSENKLNYAFGKYSFILKTNQFRQIMGYDERYEGWGFQDLDLISRLPKKIYSEVY